MAFDAEEARLTGLANDAFTQGDMFTIQANTIAEKIRNYEDLRYAIKNFKVSLGI